jgi:predicted acetyltransferase
VQIRPITDDEVPAFRASLMLTFGGDPAADPGGDERFRALIEAGRAFAAFDGSTLVATAATFTLTLAIPGGALPMAGLTMVTVRPTHRRRGLLRGLLDLHLEDAGRRGEPMSGLWASEGGIYGRFGYGIAAEGDELSFTSTGLEVAVPGGDADAIELVDDVAAAAALPEIYPRALHERPGTYARTPAWWTYRRFTDRPDLRKDASPRRFAIARRDGVATGWMVYRQRLTFEGSVSAGEVQIEELVGVDARAEASLWRYAAQIDLFPKVSWGNAPVDTMLPWVVADSRRIQRRREDTLWLRPGDIAAVLAARRYRNDGTLRLAVDGATYELIVAQGVVRCAETDAAPDLHLGRAALGSLYLGGVSAMPLARAGRIVGRHAAVVEAERMFSWPIAPWCQEMF